MTSDKYTRCPTCGKQTKLEIWLNGEIKELTDGEKKKVFILRLLRQFTSLISSLTEMLNNEDTEIGQRIVGLTIDMQGAINDIEGMRADEPTVQVNTEGE